MERELPLPQSALKFLIDNALPPQLADLLSAAGHDALHVRTHRMQAAEDVAILAKASEEDRIVVSADSDFGTILAAQEMEHPITPTYYFQLCQGCKQILRAVAPRFLK